MTGYLDVAAEEGAKVLTGGRGEGWFGATDGARRRHPADCAVCREEIFGPVVVVQPFETEDEAVSLANDSPYGLNAMVFTENLRRAHRVAAAAAGRHRLGRTASSSATSGHRSAAIKDSGMGREGGRYSREFFTESKAVVMEIGQ